MKNILSILSDREEYIFLQKTRNSSIVRYLITFLLVFYAFFFQAQPISGVINNYASVSFVGGVNLFVSSTAGFAAGDRIMIIQMKGVAVNNQNNANFGTITNMSTAGNFEFLDIASINGNWVFLVSAPVNNYNFISGFVQIVKVPRYCSARVTNTLNCLPWSDVSGCGGVLALEAGTLILTSDINVDGMGFRGGRFGTNSFTCNTGLFAASFGTNGGEKGESVSHWIPSLNGCRAPQANGGGGANRGNSGGGGGANGGAGGRGGDQWNLCNPIAGEHGMDGISLPQGITTMFLGGGGGGGFMDNGLTCSDGGNGGGIIYIKANTIVCNNRIICANGQNVTVVANFEGAGGGGAGGTIFIECGNYSGNLIVNALGGFGGSNFNSFHFNECHGPGGGGGGGVFAYSGGTFPAAVTLNTGGGAPGFVTNPQCVCFGSSRGAMAGASGLSIGNLPAPPVPNIAIAGSHTYCGNSNSPLALSANSSLGASGSYSWQPGPFFGQNINVSPTVTTIYTVTVNTVGPFCPISDTILVTVTNNCCDQSQIPGYTTLGINQISTGSNLTGPILIMQNTTIGTTPGDVYFTNSEFLMAPNVQLNVVPGVQLHLVGAHLYACGTQMWQGIYVDNGANVLGVPGSNNVTLIEDAITALDVNGTASLGLFELFGTIFNRNHTAIRIQNLSQANFGMAIRECVFTCRALPFTSSSWPNSSFTAGGLRCPNISTAGIVPPYDLAGHNPILLKMPFNNEYSNYGIQLNNIGNQPGGFPSAGVDVGLTNQVTNGFNLFDGLGIGIDVTDASLTTMNNVFQNMKHFQTQSGMFGGTGIRQIVSPGNMMNAGLFLNPIGGLYQSNDYGNRFWNCYEGINATDLFEIQAEYNIFRSNQQVTIPGYGPGATGISIRSNRFQYNIKFCEFNNVACGIRINVNSGPYDLGGPQNGVYAGALSINENYFGAQVNSTLSLGANEYMVDAIIVDGPNLTGFQTVQSGELNSNKVHRSFNGIHFNDMSGYPISISGNSITLNDDLWFGSPRQTGIHGSNTNNSLLVHSNTLNATGMTNPVVTLIYSENNIRPVIQCNDLSNSYQAFEFNGVNQGTDWRGNKMFNHEMGLVISNNGYINQQGSPGFPSDNEWNGTWSGPPYETFMLNSNAFLSPLYVQTNSSPFYPLNNGVAGGAAYTPFDLFVTGGTPYMCQNLGLPAPPSQRSGDVNEITGLAEGNSEIAQFSLYPNPATGYVQIMGSDGSNYTDYAVFDISGKMLLSGDFRAGSQKEFEVSKLNNGIYLVVIQANGTTYRNKLVVAK